MSENVKKTIVIFAAIFGLIVLMFGVVIAKIVYIQTVEYDKWEKLSKANRSSSTITIPAARGDIYDAEGRIQHRNCGCGESFPGLPCGQLHYHPH